MDILLVNAPVSRLSPHAKRAMPLGLAYIGAMLRNAGYQVQGLDLNATPVSDAQLKQFLDINTIPVVGISTYTETHPNGIRFAQLVKILSPSTKVVIGGPHASVLHEEAAHEKEVDVVVRGEGELTMLELADYYLKSKGKLKNINGITFVNNAELTVTEDRDPITDIDTLPFPARELFPIHRYDYPATVLTSRGGCPFACNFCAVNNIWKGKRRFRSPDKVMEEIIYLSHIQQIQTGRLNFVDDALTLDRSRTLELCQMLKEHFGITPLDWQCGTRVDLVDDKLLKEMHQTGCQSIQYGIESGSQKILDSIGKKIRLEQVKKTVQMTLDYGIETTCSFMFPHPEDTEETIRMQIALMKELKETGAVITLAMTTPLPGTYLYEHKDELGIKILAKNWDEYDCKHLIITNKYLTRDRLQALLQEMMLEVGMKQNLNN